MQMMAESADDLRCALNEFSYIVHSGNWMSMLKKQKILIFSKGPIKKRHFYYNKSIIENVKDLKYLGIVFSRSGSFCKFKKHLYERAQKAMYGVIRKIRL